MRQDGFSLVELLMSTLILSLAMAGLYSMLMQTETYYESVADDASIRQQARVAMSQLTSELQSAGYNIKNVTENISSASGAVIQFAGDIDNGSNDAPCGAAFEGATDGGVERVSFSYDSDEGTLRRSVDCWDGAAWTVESTDVIVLTNILADGTIFRYWDQNGTEIVPGATGLSADQRAAVRSVTIKFDLFDLADAQFVGDEYTNFQLKGHVKLRNME